MEYSHFHIWQIVVKQYTNTSQIYSIVIFMLSLIYLCHGFVIQVSGRGDREMWDMRRCLSAEWRVQQKNYIFHLRFTIFFLNLQRYGNLLTDPIHIIMTRGKQTCKILKEICRQIAEANDIEFVVSECRYKGDCLGTCPKCEAEVRYLEQQLRIRSLAGKAVSSRIVAMSFCEPRS